MHNKLLTVLFLDIAAALKRPIWIPVLMLAAVLAACAHNNVRQQTAEQLAAYTAAAQQSVSSFPLSRGLYSWVDLGNDALVVYTQPKKAYLLSVTLCNGLPDASSVGLTSNSGWVTSGMDKVVLSGEHYDCQILDIRPVDLAKFKAIQEQQRKPG